MKGIPEEDDMDGTIRILIVEEDAELNRMLCGYLVSRGFETESSPDAESAWKKLRLRRFHMVIADTILHKMDGFAFSGKIHDQNPHIPILFLSARDYFPEKMEGFRVGLDDLMEKPPDPEELLLRVRALLRRVDIKAGGRILAGNLEMDVDAMTVEVDKKEISLTLREFGILHKLLSCPQKVLSRKQLMDEFWGTDTDTGPRAVDVYVTKLREKLADCDGFRIRTVRGIGYQGVLL